MEETQMVERPAEQTQPEQETQEPKSDVTETFKRDMIRYKMERNQEREEKAQLMQKVKELEEQRLSEIGDYKKLWENEKNLRVQKEQENEQIYSGYSREKKFAAVEREALKLGIRPEALEDLSLMELDSVIVEGTTTGRTNVLGAEEFVQSLKQKRPYWFATGKMPHLDTGNPGMAEPKTMTAADILKLQKTDPAAYKREMQKLMSK